MHDANPFSESKMGIIYSHDHNLNHTRFKHEKENSVS